MDHADGSFRSRGDLGFWGQRLAHLLGVRTIETSPRRREVAVRASWGEITFTRARRALGLGVNLIDWCDLGDIDHNTLMVRVPTLALYLKLPRWLFPPAPRRESWGEIDRWGFEFSAVDMEFPSQLHLSWGHWCRIIDLPWASTLYRRSYLLATGGWYHDRAFEDWARANARNRRINWIRRILGSPLRDPPERPDAIEHMDMLDRLNKHTEHHPYCYVLQSGVAQDVVATVTIEEWEVRRSWLVWTRLGARIHRSLDVKFSEGIGERADSWKGGVIGTGQRLLPGELPIHALQRMQQERKF